MWRFCTTRFRLPAPQSNQTVDQPHLDLALPYTPPPPAPSPTPTHARPAQAAHTAAVVNELSNEIQRILESHPLNQQRRAEGLNAANVVLLRGCGCRIKVPLFQELHRMRACLVAPTKIIAGVSACLSGGCLYVVALGGGYCEE